MSADDAAARPFSESWHRVSDVRVALRSSVRAHRQVFRAQEWVVLRDTLSSDWFRITQEAWQFVSRLDGRYSVDEAWRLTLEIDAATALTQEEVVQLLGQLNMSNLLTFDRASAGGSLFERYRKRRARETRALLAGFLAIKVPLLDPDRMLEKALPLIRAVFGVPGALVYLVLLAWAGKVLIDRSDALFAQGAGVLAPDNLVLLYVGFVIAKVVHEFGHAAMCKRFGGEVHKMGVMLLILAPMPYVDATSAWGFRHRYQRVLVGSAGVLTELAVAAVGALVWAHTAPGTVNALAYNVIFVASVSTVLFNLNPLLRFDGYHMLADLIDVPNLFQRSREQLRYLAERFLFRLPGSQPAARTRTESVLLPVYGVVSIAYWLVLMVSIIAFIADQYLDLGVALAWMLAFMVLVLPVLKLLKYLASSPRLAHYRARTVGVAAGVAVLAFVLLAGVPVPDRIRAAGVVEASHFRQVHADTAGFVAEVRADPGGEVKQGQVLMRLRNTDLEFELRAARMQREQLLAQELRAMSTTTPDVAPLRRQREAVDSLIAELERQRTALTIVAPMDGVWSVPAADVASGRWVARGMPVGAVVDPRDWRFVAVLPQVSTHLFDNEVQQVEVRLRGEEGVNVLGTDVRIVPFETGKLPTPALGFPGGGEIAVSPQDAQGLTAAEPFFRIHARLPADGGKLPRLAHGRLGTMRLTLDNRPLLFQWERSLRQFLQRRFRV